MSLNSAVIRDGLIDLTTRYPHSTPEACARWAQMYATYAVAATTVTGGVPVTVAAAQPILQAALIPAFTGFAKPQIVSAQQITTALTAFWLTPPMAFFGTLPGTVTLVGGIATLPPALVAAWIGNLSGQPSKRDACQRIADAIHAFTLSVIVTEITGVLPPTIIGPIS